MNTDWRAVLVRYMASVGDAEGIFFEDHWEHPGISDKDWSKVVVDAQNLLNKSPNTLLD